MASPSNLLSRRNPQCIQQSPNTATELILLGVYLVWLRCIVKWLWYKHRAWNCGLELSTKVNADINTTLFIMSKFIGNCTAIQSTYLKNTQQIYCITFFIYHIFSDIISSKYYILGSTWIDFKIFMILFCCYTSVSALYIFRLEKKIIYMKNIKTIHCQQSLRVVDFQEAQLEKDNLLAQNSRDLNKKVPTYWPSTSRTRILGFLFILFSLRFLF